MSRANNQWIWYLFVIVGVGVVASASFVGKFNPRNKNLPKMEDIVLLRPEKDCRPLSTPCAALSKEQALVVRVYPNGKQARLLVKTLGLDAVEEHRLDAVWLKRDGAPLGEPVSLGPARDGGYTVDLSEQREASMLRVALRYRGKLLVADLPLK